ncbi:MAG: type II secretion system secretin GspD [Deltaproteobacteria bacterium]|nr:type II secretion system secretin GspD [Candidatus Anaeroferrophillus wilburensis]MBN2888361.1 type II secretion system secretin GspD [Deltaproteobacteria bacterium]
MVMMKKSRLFLVLLAVLLSCSSCALYEPSVRHDSAVAGEVFSYEKPASAATGMADAAEDGTLSDTLSRQGEEIRLLEERQQQFNERLAAVSTAPGRVAGEQKKTSSKAAKVSSRQKVAFHFDSADLLDVVRMFMELLDCDYLLHPEVGGKVTMEFEEELDGEGLLDLFRGVLRTQGAAIIEQDKVLEILPLSSVPGAIDSQGLVLDAGAGPVRGQAIKAFHLSFISPLELTKVITPFLSKGALVNAHEGSGILLVSDYPHSLAKISRLVELFDVSAFAGLQMKMYQLQHVEAEAMAQELDGLAKSVGLSAEQQKSANGALSFLPFPRLNLLLALSRNGQLMEFADLWISELDRELALPIKEEKHEGVFVYYVQNGVAANIIEVLQGLFGEGNTEAAEQAKKDKAEVPQGVKRLTSGLEKEAPQKVPPEAVSGTLDGPVNFVVDETTNAILVRSLGSDYRKILPVIKKLDLFPRQVLIETTIAEVLLDESTKLGIEWQYLANGLLGTSATGTVSLDSGLGVISGSGTSLIGSGFSYLVSNTGRFTAMVRALADQNRVNVLSSPHVLASDNQPARIDIGEEVPIVTSEYRTNEATSTATTVDKTIQYRDTGIILEVTPHINENGMVRMEIRQEVSELSDKTVEGVNSPIFRKRVATTTLAVKDQQTIVIGGLISQSKSKTASGLPGLRRIPGLKYLFGYEGKAYESAELMIFITPHVISSEDDSTFVSKNFITRLEKIKDLIN